MTTHSPAERPDRDPIFDTLRDAYAEMDPVPDGLADRVLVALALDDLDLEYELLTLVHRSEQLAGVRSRDDTKTVLEFTADGLTVMLRVSTVDSGHRRIDGWVSPAQSLVASLWQEHATLEAAVGAQGRFEFDAVPHGLTRLDLLRVEAAGAERSTAFRTTLFEI